MDNTIKNAKGYYEFVGMCNEKNVIFRFNIKSFKNNYKATDLQKMDISIYAIRVGKSSVEKLNFNNEFEIEKNLSRKDNPEYQKKEKEPENKSNAEEPDVFDVLLAGVEVDD